MNPVKEAAQRADEMIAELNRQAREGADEVPAVETSAPEEGAVNEDQGVQAQPAPVAEPDESVDLLRESAAKWEQRYRSLDGMLQSRDRQIEQLHQLLADMQASKSSKPAEPEKSLVTKEDEDTFGADLLDVARRVARDENAQYIRALETKLAKFEAQLGSVATTAAESAQERFQNRLSQMAPNWSVTDRDPNFITWLQASPTRQRIFAESVQSQDLDGVAQFYLDFEVLTGKQATPVVPSTTNEPQAPDPRLARQVSPGKSRSSPTPITEGNKRQWTRTGIADFFVNRKKYPVDEANRIERDIFTAQKDGRVDYSR
jgi:hypothetical protein